MPLLSTIRERCSRSLTMPPPVDSPDEAAIAIHDEIGRIARIHRGFFDSMVYNVGTIVALLFTGAATVLATMDTRFPWASVFSAVAAFVIAAQRSLDFGGRWRWHLQRRTEYWALGYRLNAVTLNPDAHKRTEGYIAILKELEEQAAFEAFVPGGSGAPAMATGDAKAGKTEAHP